MLELQPFWFCVLLLNFLGLLFILNLILFQPLLRHFQKRDDSISGALSVAKEMNAKREEALASMNRELREARNKAKEIFEAVRKEGAQQQKAIIEKANAQASDLIEKARGELKAETEKARQRLRSDVEKLSDEIVRKLVGA
jgi:F-type H+-transporting ATPase subunit b